MANTSEFPRPPPLYSLRSARLEDVDRLALVGIAGFRHSQIFEFERPYYEKYPQDTFKSFQELWRDLICDPNTVTLVAEDDYDEQEDNHEPSVQSHMFPRLKKPNGRVIVGAASWTYEAGSKRREQFACPRAQNSSLVSMLFGFFSTKKSSLRRDEILDRTRRVNEVVAAANENWGKRLADMHGVNQGMLPSRMGEKIAFAEGFDHIGDVHVDGDEKNPEGIDLAVGLYKSKKRTATVG
ncbi:hypothetical protein QQS21_012257 [Conoideocrella luteorostrata]|uniref:Uncharacterized protein n=1 Tax=Conoideocrella luteorostrata TaxID=1105319 RepID=A0AAJ0FSL7_9HYPO|nr:hypothetical protein QQS21_012257 [Conoideocrella luteorostrata]